MTIGIIAGWMALGGLVLMALIPVSVVAILVLEEAIDL